VEGEFTSFVKKHTVKPVYKGDSREPENVAFKDGCPLYTG